MGTNNLATKNDGDVASSSDINQYKTALSGDLVPRNSSGVPEDNGANFGLSAFRWLKGFFTSIRIGSAAANNTIEEDSGSIVFKVNGNKTAEIGEFGLTSDSLQGVNFANSPDFDDETFLTDGTVVDVTAGNLNITPTRSDGIIHISVSPRVSAPLLSRIQIGSAATGDNALGFVYLKANSTIIATFPFTVHTDGPIYAIPASSVNMLYRITSASTINFSLAIGLISGSVASIRIQGRLMAVEIL